MHGTRPSTIGLVVQSSPVALLAWLGEKFRDWTDDDLNLDQVLETVTLWWVLECFPKAIYAYEQVSILSTFTSFISLRQPRFVSVK